MLPAGGGVTFYVPAVRREVSYAVGTGDVRPWEERLLRVARERRVLSSAAGRGDKTGGAERRGRAVHFRVFDLFSSPAAGDGRKEERDDDGAGEKGVERGESSGGYFWSGWFGAERPAPACAPDERAPCAHFSGLTGENFYLLLEHIHHAIAAPTSSPPLSSGCTTPMTFLPPFFSFFSPSLFMCWNEALLHILSSLLTFHGSVPSVARFISVLLCGHVTLLLRSRYEDRHDGNHPHDSSHSHVRHRDGVPSGEKGTNAVKSRGPTKNEGKSDVSLLRSPVFSSILLRLAQMYYPLWRALEEQGDDVAIEERLSTYSFYTHCVPASSSVHDVFFPQKKGDCSGGGSSSSSNSHSNGDGTVNNSNKTARNTNNVFSVQEKGPKPRQRQTRRAKIMQSVFDRTSVLNIGAGLFDSDAVVRPDDEEMEGMYAGHPSHGERRRNNKEREEKDEGDEEDIPLRWEHVHEIVVCVALAEVGRLALLHENFVTSALLDRRRSASPREEKEACVSGGADERQGRDVANDRSGMYASFLRCVRHCGQHSTSAMMSCSAKILLSCEEGWRGQSADDVRTSATTTTAATKTTAAPQTEEHGGRCARSNHHFLATVMCDVLKIICQASGGVLLPSSPTSLPFSSMSCCPSVRPRPGGDFWVYEPSDHYYINLLLACCCAAGEELPASLLPFTVQLTQFALSHAVVSGKVDPKQPSAVNKRLCVGKEGGSGGRCNEGNTAGDGDDDNDSDGGESTEGGNCESDGEDDSDVDGDESHVIATGTLCMTACKFLRCGYQRGCVVPNNEHIGWLSTLLQRKVHLWERALSRTVLLMNIFFDTTGAQERRWPRSVHVNVSLPPEEERERRQRQQLQSQQRAWRAVWWRTIAVLESIYVFRDVFRFASTWSVVDDTTPFRAVMQKLGVVLRRICWIDFKGRETNIDATSCLAHAADDHFRDGHCVWRSSLCPFPILASTGKRFFLGAVLVYVMSAAADTIFWFRAWMDERGAFFSDVNDEVDGGGDDMNSNDDDDRSSHSSNSDSSDRRDVNSRLSGEDQVCSSKRTDVKPSTASTTPAVFHPLRSWLHDFCSVVLLPSCARVLQSIALCAMDEVMLPAILRLHRIVRSNSLLHLVTAHADGAHDHGPCSSCANGGFFATGRLAAAAMGTPRQGLFFSRKAEAISPASSSFAQTLRTATEVMEMACRIQRALLAFAPFTRISLDDRVGDSEVVARWMKAAMAPQSQHRLRYDIVLHVVESVVLRVPWALWTSASLRLSLDEDPSGLSFRGAKRVQRETEAACFSSSSSSFSFPFSQHGKRGRNKKKEQGVHGDDVCSYDNTTPLGISAHVEATRKPIHFSPPPPPPVFGAMYVMDVVSALLRFIVMDSRENAKHKSLDDLLLQRAHAVLFGLLNSLFRALDAAAFCRSSMHEQLRRRGPPLQPRSEHPATTALNEGEKISSSSFLSSFLELPSVLSGLATSMLFAAPETDAERVMGASVAAIDTFVDYHQRLTCDSVIHIACALRSIQRELWTCRYDADCRSAVSASCCAALRLLGQQSLELLLPGNMVPETFAFAPLPDVCDEGTLLQPQGDRAGAFVSVAAATRLYMAVTTAITSIAAQGPAAKSRLDDGPPPTESVLQQANTLVRVMALIASLTRSTESDVEDTQNSCDHLCADASTTSSAGSSFFVLHPATLSFSQWRKLCFALHAMRAAELHGATCAETRQACDAGETGRAHSSPPCRQLKDDPEVCSGRCTSAECERHLRLYIAAALPCVNRTRLDVLICRATTAEERRKLFAVLLLLHRAVLTSPAACGQARGAPGELPGTNDASEIPSGDSCHRGRRLLPPGKSQRGALRALLRTIAAFAFGVRPLQSADELLR